MRFATSLVALALVGTASTLEAQTCLGIASFSTGPIRIDGSFNSADGANTLGAGVSVGAPKGPFGGVSVSRIEAENSDESVTGFGLQGGWELDLSAARTSSAAARWSLCPVVGFTQYKESASEGGQEVSATVRMLTAGLSVGTTVAPSQAVTLAPFGTLSLARLSLSWDGIPDEFEELVDDQSETGGMLDLGLGFVFNQRFTVRPTLTIPLGFEGSDTSFGVSVHFNFGRSR